MRWWSPRRAALVAAVAIPFAAASPVHADDVTVRVAGGVLQVEGQQRVRTNALFQVQADGRWRVTNRNEGGTVNGQTGSADFPPAPEGVSVRTHDRLESLRFEGHPDVTIGPILMDVGRPRAAHVVPDLVEFAFGRAQRVRFGAGAVEVVLTGFELVDGFRCQGWCHLKLEGGSAIGGDLVIRGAKPFMLRSSTLLLDMEGARVGGRVAVRNTELVRVWIRDSTLSKGLKIDGGATFVDLRDVTIGSIDIRNKGPESILPGNIPVQGALPRPPTTTTASALLHLERTDVLGTLRLNHRLGSLSMFFDAALVERKFRVRARGGSVKELLIERSSFGDRIDVELGDGDDRVRIDAEVGELRAGSALQGDVKIHLGPGDDSLRIGAAMGRAAFEQLVDLDGGKGLGALDIDASAEFAQEPKLRRFE